MRLYIFIMELHKTPSKHCISEPSGFNVDACLNSDLGDLLFRYVIVLAFPSVTFRKICQRGYNYFALRGIRFFLRKSIRPVFTQRGKTQICK